MEITVDDQTSSSLAEPRTNVAVSATVARSLVPLSNDVKWFHMV